MQSESTDKSARNRWILTCVGLSIILGIVSNQVFNFDDAGKFHVVSFTGRGPVMDVALVTTALLAMMGGIELTAFVGSASLIVLGTALLLLGFGGPHVLSHISPDIKIDPVAHSSILVLSTLLFLGAVFLGSGFQRLFGGNNSESTAKDEASNEE